MTRLLVLLPVLFLLAACATPPPAPSAGPILRTMTEPDGTARTTALGPFHESATYPDGTSLSAPLRPLWTEATRPNPRDYRHDWAFLWPIASGRTLGHDRTWRFLVFFGDNRDVTAGTNAAHHTLLLPFWFSGQTRSGETYRALFPLGGTICDLLVKDRIEFVLFPIWARSSINDVTTTDWLWPFISRTTTPDGHIDKFRVFPFYSRNTTRGHFEKTTIAWPFWSHSRFDYKNSHGTSWVLFPFYGRTRLSDQSGWMVLPPLIQHGVATNGDFRTFAPWPFYIHKKHGALETFHLWPLYGRRTEGPLNRQYWLWPILTHEQNAYSTTRYRRWTLAPFFSVATYTRSPDKIARKQRLATTPAALDAAATNAPETLVRRRLKLWPLFTHQTQREPILATRFVFPDLWPGPTPAVVERSWAPLWTLLDYRAALPADAPADAEPNTSLSLLWGLYRQSDAPASPATPREYELFPFWRHLRPADDSSRHWSVLKGLLAYDRTASERRLRLLWIPFTLSPPETATPAANPEGDAAP